MTRDKIRKATRVAAGALALAFVCGGPARAGDLDGMSLEACGKWVLKLRDFGKQKINDYNAWVPANFRTTDGKVQPKMTIQFGTLGPGTWLTQVIAPNRLGQDQTVNLAGTYGQKGKKLKFQVTQVGINGIQTLFERFSENQLFGKRELVTDFSFVKLREPERLRFKGRVKDGDRLKLKFKAMMQYDIQYEIGSEYADIFGAKGIFKLRAATKHCD